MKKQLAPVMPDNSSELDVPSPLGEYLQTTLGRMDLKLASATVDEAFVIAGRGLQMEMAGKIFAGRALIHLRDTMEKRSFAAGLRERGIPLRTAYDSIALYQTFASLPDSESVRALARIGTTKVGVLSRLSGNDLAALAHGDEVHGITLEQAEELSSRDLDALVKQVESPNTELSRLATTNAKLETELSKFRQQARAQAALRASEDLPLFAREPREEALVASEAMMQSLELIDDAVLRNLLAEVDHPEALRWQPAAARTVAYALGPVAMRIGRLIKELRERFGDSVIGPLDADSFLEPSEALGLMMGRQQLLKQAQELAQGRDDARANSTPGKRGRKRGTKIDTGA